MFPVLSIWAVTPTRLPAVRRRCHPCGGDRFRANGKFRVNAHHKLLDIWLLALCASCGETVKLSVLERVNVRTVRPDLLDRLHDNDLSLAAELLQDPAVLRRNRVALDWDGAWRLDTGEPAPQLPPEGEAVEVSVCNTLRVPVRPVRLIAEGFGLPRAEAERLAAAGRLVSTVRLTGKLSGGFTFTLKR